MLFTRPVNLIDYFPRFLERLSIYSILYSSVFKKNCTTLQFHPRWARFLSCFWFSCCIIYIKFVFVFTGKFIIILFKKLNPFSKHNHFNISKVKTFFNDPDFNINLTFFFYFHPLNSPYLSICLITYRFWPHIDKQYKSTFTYDALLVSIHKEKVLNYVKTTKNMQS